MHAKDFSHFLFTTQYFLREKNTIRNTILEYLVQKNPYFLYYINFICDKTRMSIYFVEGITPWLADLYS